MIRMAPGAVRKSPRGRGGTGRHAGFRCGGRKPWGFESLRPHLGSAYGPNGPPSGSGAPPFAVWTPVPRGNWGQLGDPARVMEEAVLVCRDFTEIGANMRVGLVLGAGGVVGASWLIGALDA